jgi:hypothetical protein
MREFTSSYRLRLKRDRCGDPIIRGKLGHLYEHDLGRFGLVLEAPAGSTRLDRTLRARKHKALAAGFTLHQEGDAEAILLFNPEDHEQAQLAPRLVGAKRRRVASEAQLAVLSRAREASRIAQNPAQRASSRQNGDDLVRVRGAAPLHDPSSRGRA